MFLAHSFLCFLYIYTISQPGFDGFAKPVSVSSIKCRNHCVVYIGYQHRSFACLTDIRTFITNKISETRSYDYA